MIVLRAFILITIVVFLWTVILWSGIADRNSYRKFINNLRKVAQGENWYFDDRGRFRLDKYGRTFCPVTWTYYLKTGDFLSVGLVSDAARRIGLTRVALQRAMEATDTASLSKDRLEIQQILSIPDSISS